MRDVSVMNAADPAVLDLWEQAAAQVEPPVRVTSYDLSDPVQLETAAQKFAHRDQEMLVEGCMGGVRPQSVEQWRKNMAYNKRAGRVAVELARRVEAPQDLSDFWRAVRQLEY